MSVFCVRLLISGAATGGGGVTNADPTGTFRMVDASANFEVIIAVTSPLGVTFPVIYAVNSLNAPAAIARALVFALIDWPPGPGWTLEPQASAAGATQQMASGASNPFWETSLVVRAASVAAAGTAAVLAYTNYLVAPASVQAVAAEPRG